MFALPIVGREGLGPNKREYCRGLLNDTDLLELTPSPKTTNHIPGSILSKYEREEPADEPWPTPYSCIRDMT
jgi:hypothetical protein